MNIRLVAGATKSNKIMWVIEWFICPIDYMVNIKLFDLILRFTTKDTTTVVSFLDEHSNCSPPFSTIVVSPAFPMRTFVSSFPFGPIVSKSFPFRYGPGKNNWISKWARWIILWMGSTIFTITSLATKQSFTMGLFLDMFFSAVRTDQCDSISFSLLSELTSTLDRAGMRFIVAAIKLVKIPLYHRMLFAT